MNTPSWDDVKVNDVVLYKWVAVGEDEMTFIAQYRENNNTNRLVELVEVECISGGNPDLETFPITSIDENYKLLQILFNQKSVMDTIKDDFPEVLI